MKIRIARKILRTRSDGPLFHKALKRLGLLNHYLKTVQDWCDIVEQDFWRPGPAEELLKHFIEIERDFWMRESISTVNS